jgi:tyrosinase-like protein
LAAFSYSFTASVETCGNCAKQEEERVKITSSEVLTPMLIDYIKIGELRSLEPSDVKPFLVDGLRWRVSTVGFSVNGTVCFMTDMLVLG